MVKLLFFLIFVPFLLNAASPPKLHQVKKRHYAIGQILSFSIPQQIAPSLIDETDHAIYIVVHAGDNVTSVAPTITWTPGYTVDPGSGVPQNFSSAIAYGVYDVNGVRSSYYSVNVLSTRVVLAGCSPASTTVPGDVMPGGPPVLSIQWQMLVGGVWLPATGQNDQNNYQTPTYTNNTGAPVRYTFRRQLTTSFGAAYDSYSDYSVDPPLSGGNVISQPAGSATTFCGTTDAEFLNGPAPTGGDGTYTYQWQSNTGSGWNNITNNGNLQGYNAPSSATTISYRRVITSSSCSPVTSNPITMTVTPAVSPGTLTPPTSSTFCQSGSPGAIPETPATGGNGTYNYQWQTQDASGTWVNVPTGGTSENYNPGTIAATTTYRRTVTSGACNTPVATNPIIITINTPASNNTIQDPPVKFFCTLGDPGTIEGSVPVVDNGITFTYQWQTVNGNNIGTDIPGATGQNYSPGTLTVTATLRRLVMTSGACTIPVLSNPVTITVQPPVTNNSIIAPPVTSFCGTSAFPDQITGSDPQGGTGNYTYKWYTSTDGTSWNYIVNRDTRDITPATVTTPKTYFRRDVISGSCITPVESNIVVFTLRPPVGNNTITPSGLTAFCVSGSPGIINGSAPTGGDGVNYTYAWLSSTDGVNYSPVPTGGTSANYDPGTVSQTTWFERTITSGECSTPQASNTVKITIQQKLDNNTIPTNYNFCKSGDPGTITGSTPTGGDGSYSYQWYSSSTLNGSYSPINGATGPNFMPGTISVTTYYKRDVISGACTTPLESNILTVHVTPPITQSPISATPYQPCVGGDPGYFQVGFASGGDGPRTFTYQWESAPTANGPWTTIQGATDAQYDPAGLIQTTFFHRIAYSGSCSNTSNAAEVVVKQTPPIVALDPVAAVCPGTPVTFKVTNPDPILHYIWYDSADLSNAVNQGTSFNITATGTTPIYYVVANNGSCSSPTPTEAKVNVSQIPATPQVQVSQGATQSDPTCIGSDVTLAAGAPNDGLTYNWYTTATGGIAAKPNQQSITITVTTTTTVWYVEAVNGTGCSSANRAMVTVYATTPPVVALHANAVCAGTTATLTADNTDPDISVYWYDAATGGNNLGSGNSIATPVITGPTTFYAETRTANCTLANRIPVKVDITQPLQAPVVVFDSATSSSITFSWGAVAEATAYQYSIDGGQSFSSPTIADNALEQTIDNLQLAQSVTIIVRALGATICETSANSAPVTGVTKNPLADNIFVANAFTPNGDGRNDIVYVHNPNIKSLKFYVYNQYGELLFTSLSQSKGWDGTYKGKLEPVGVYVYYLEAIMNDGKQVNKKGTITLLR